MSKVTRMKTLPDKPKELDRKSAILQTIYEDIGKTSILPSPNRYNMTICHSKNFIWFRVPKVGTRTIFHHLKESGVTLDVEYSFQLHYPVNAYRNYFKFAFVRNPWDRLVSAWQQKVVDVNLFQFSPSDHEEMKSFKNFVEYVSTLNIKYCNIHFRSQSQLIDLNEINYLGRFENFVKDAGIIFKRIGLPEAPISHKNAKSNQASYRFYYNEELVEKVAKIYSRDIQLFGYKF